MDSNRGPAPRLAAAILSVAARPRLCAWLVFALALLMRAALALSLPNEVLWADGHRYLKVADNLLTTGGFGGVLDNAQSVPTLPLLLAGVMAVAGHSLPVLRLVTALLGALTCVLGYQYARRWFAPGTALLAGLALACYPHLIYMSSLFEYPQTLFGLLIGAFFLLLYDDFKVPRAWRLVLAGLLLGLANLTVPTVLPYVGFMLLLLLIQQGWRGAARWPLFVACAMLPCLLWGWRNYTAYGDFDLVNKTAGFNLFQANNSSYYRYGKQAIIPECAMGYEYSDFCVTNRLFGLIGDPGRESELLFIANRERLSRAAAIAFWRETPGQALELTLRKELQFWSPNPDAVSINESNSTRFQFLISMVSYVPALLLALLALWQLRHRWREWLPVAGLVALFAGVYAIMLPSMRYRIPLELYFALFACYPVGRWLRLEDSSQA